MSYENGKRKLSDSRIPRFILAFAQWLIATFVALTVAGQQENSRHKPPALHFRFWIFDFRLSPNPESEIENGCAAEFWAESLLSLASVCGYLKILLNSSSRTLTLPFQLKLDGNSHPAFYGCITAARWRKTPVIDRFGGGPVEGFTAGTLIDLDGLRLPSFIYQDPQENTSFPAVAPGADGILGSRTVNVTWLHEIRPVASGSTTRGKAVCGSGCGCGSFTIAERNTIACRGGK